MTNRMTNHGEEISGECISGECISGEDVCRESKLKESVLLLGLRGRLTPGETDAAASLRELAALTETAGGLVKDSMIIHRDRPDPSRYFGKGKLEEIMETVADKGIDLVIVDDELSVRQGIRLEQLFPCRIIDRTALILQIFADHAKTREGKLQIELAQLSYMLPRLSGKGRELSRLGGGIGTRGPGESRLEKDRRHIRRRIDSLKAEIGEIRRRRDINRGRRQRNQVPVIALVGYTNAGKSSLLNLLTDAGANAEDKLFATLDPVTRRLRLAETEVLLTDTVGFIRQLPHSLIAAFRATLEEAAHADLLIHVIDSADGAIDERIKTVYQVLEEMGCKDKPVLHAFNKADKLEDKLDIRRYLYDYRPAVLISAATGEGAEELRKQIAEQLPDTPVSCRFRLSQEEGAVLNRFYRLGHVSQLCYAAESVSGLVTLPGRLVKQFGGYLTETEGEAKNDVKSKAKSDADNENEGEGDRYDGED